jgi:hypothetical protein
VPETRRPPKLATKLLRSAAANEPALVGDLLERFQAGQSPSWYWRQVIAVVGRTVSFGVRASSRILPVVLALALLGSIVTFAVNGWIVPASNQAFRFTVVQREVARAAPELNFVQLHSLMGASDDAIYALAPLSDRWDVATNYYARFAVSCSPIAFALFGVWAATLSRVNRRLLVVSTACAYVLLFLAVYPQQAKAFSPFVVAWFPTTSIAVIALLVRWYSPERLSLTSQTS